MLWIGAFISFTGGWIQNVAQGWLVYELTADPAKLALVTFCMFAPTTLFGPIAGALADMYNRRVVLVLCQLVFASGALFLAAATYYGFVEYWHILAVATVNGFANCVETPTRQATVSRVVPIEDLPSAVPLQAMTFNLARVLGPALGGILLAAFGPQLCYLLNGISYVGLIAAVLAIRSNLRASAQEPQPLTDLLTEGMKYTFRDRRLRVLFILESAVALFGLPYIALLPALAKDVLSLDQRGLGLAMAAIGIGAVSALVLVAVFNSPHLRPKIIRYAMSILGVGLVLLGSVGSAALAYPLLVVIGMAAVAQFNSTNTLFQILSPDRLRGRTIAMHIWALSGLNPIGAILFGWIAREATIPVALQIGGACVILCALWGWTQAKVFSGTVESLNQEPRRDGRSAAGAQVTADA